MNHLIGILGSYTNQAPPAPATVTMGTYTAGATTISVSWTTVAAATSYTVTFYSNTTDSTSGGTVFQTITGVAGTSQSSSNTLVNNTYYYASVATITSGVSSIETYSSTTILTVSGGSVTTLAGSGSAAFADGTGTGASFYTPMKMAVDSSGNIYVADSSNHRIRKITPTVSGGVTTWVVTTSAGSGAQGFADGTGTGANFSYPYGVAIDSAGIFYVADTSNNKIRMMTPGGVVTTIAGSGTAAFADGTGDGASFYAPAGITVDSAGNLYVADYTNHRIRKITPTNSGGVTTWVVTTIAGSGTGAFADGTGTEASFNSPLGIALDSLSNVYVADTSNHRIRKITPTVSGGVTTWVVTTFAGSGTRGFADGTGTGASFINPMDVVVDSAGNVYVADFSNHSIRIITPGGVVNTLTGSGTRGFADGTRALAKFSFPRGITMDSSGNVYVADSGNNRIRKIT